MKKKSFRFHLITLFLLVIAAASIRLFLFSGFVLGDDPGCSVYVSQILKGSYPHIGPRAVFACRPITLYFMALPIYIFGWFDWCFVLPILLASLINTVLIYLAGNKLSGSLAGVLAAVAYITFPLDVVHATTLTNDILLSTFVWGGGFLLLLSYSNYKRIGYLLLTTVSGFIVGAAVGIKLNAVVAPAIILTTVFVVLWGQLKDGGYKTLTAWIIGWLLANIILCLFFHIQSGDFLAHYHAEMRFNLDYNPSGYFVREGSLLRFLLFYPKLILGITKEGFQGYQFMPYGYFFLCFFLCLPLTFLNRFRVLLLPASLALIYMLIMEFTPLKLSPNYIPIHRLPRFLHIASMPAAVTIGIAFCILATMKNSAIKICTWLALILLTMSSLYWSYVKGTYYKDCSLDQRWAWETVKDTSGKRIITDSEMYHYLMFRFGFQPPIKIQHPEKLPEYVPAGSLVILGGTRRPEMFRTYTKNWHQNRQGEDWLLISEAPFPLKPWRLSKQRLYKVYSSSKKGSNKKSQTHFRRRHYQRHPAINKMRIIAELDVGDVASERRLNYRITKLSWSGNREFTYPNSLTLKDDGKAHQGVEKIMLNGLVPNKPIVIIKRIDPTVSHQEVKVYFKNIFVGIWSTSHEGMPAHWHESEFIIPDEVVTDTNGELSFSFEKSDSDINSFYYWFFQP